MYLSHIQIIALSLFFVFVVEALAGESKEHPILEQGASGVSSALDNTETYEERKTKHMESCLAVRDERFCAPPLRQNYQAFDEFQDCVICPVMVVMPLGDFEMGAHPLHPWKSLRDMIPRVNVTLIKPFAIGKYEIGIDEFLACQDFEVCSSDIDFKSDWPKEAAATGLSKDDAATYMNWLSDHTGGNYRLPFEVEWEYAARAGTETLFWWGNEFRKEYENCFWCSERAKTQFPPDAKGLPDYLNIQPLPRGTFAESPFKLFDFGGGAAEWTADCWSETAVEDYQFDPSSYRPNGRDDCGEHVVKGGTYSVGDASAAYGPRNKARNSRRQNGSRSFVGGRALREL